jgi:hypothetical protein
MKILRPLNSMVLLMVFMAFYALTGCGFKANPASGHSNGSRVAKAWAPSASPLDSGTVFDVTPQVAVQPDGGGAAVAVWIKREDLDPADSLPAVYHLYARRIVGGVPDASDGVCPAGGFPFGNPDATGNDGTCVIDTGSALYDAWSPRVSMDNNGDAIVVWQQHDGSGQRVYARRFSGGSWGAIQQLNDSAEFTNFDAADPAIALEPDPTSNGAPDDGVGSAMAVWSQYNEKDWTISRDATAGPASVYSMAVSNGVLYAGTGGGAGAGDIYVYDPGSDSWPLFLDNSVASGYSRVDSMADYGGKLFVGYRGATGFGDVASYDVATDSWTTVFQTGAPASNTGQYESVRSMAVYNSQLYIGLGNSVGDAEVYRCTACDGTDWVRVADTVTSGYQAVTTMAVFNNQLYIGASRTGVTADVYRCSACAGDADWTQVFSNATYDSVRSMAAHGGRLFIGMGDNILDADVWSCSICSVTADWTLVLNGSPIYEAVPSMISYNGYLYIGFGESAAGDGDIERCAVCDGSDWVFSRNDGSGIFFPATYEAVYSLSAFEGELFAGFGNTFSHGDIWRFSAGWQTAARRFVNGSGWDTIDTVCPAGSGAADGICYLSGSAGTSVQPTETPRVVMDDFGRAIAAFIKMAVLTPPNPPLTSPTCLTGTTQTQIDCTNSELHANLFNGTWSTDIDLDPDRGTTVGSVALSPQLICFQNNEGNPAQRGNNRSTVACVNVIEYDFSMNQSGQAALLIKTAWKENDDWGIIPEFGLFGGGCDGREVGNCLPDGNAFEDYMGQAIVTRQFDIANLGGTCPSWSQANVAVCWPLTRLANFGTYPVVTATSQTVSVTTPTAFGIGPFAGGCPSSITIDGGRTTLNCSFSNPRITLSPGGTTAIAVYETYDGMSYDIIAHRYDGATWGAFSQIDAGVDDAHAPQIAMDISGDGVAVWTQSDGFKFRIYSNCYATGVGSCGGGAGWQGGGILDGNVGSESGYFNPVLALSGPGGPNSALSLFLGWSLADNSTRLYYATGP